MSWHALGDWGTTRLRLFRIEGGNIVDRAEGPGALCADPEQALREALAPWSRQSPPDFIHLGGMAGARTGLREAPYVECPADAARWARKAISFKLDDLRIKIAPGLACTHADGAPDVMRGEETQIFGALNLSPALQNGAHTFLLPGTHSKWVRVIDGAIRTFQTFITGEMFALLQRSSLLGESALDASAEAEGFAAGLERAASTAPAAALFEARAAQLRAGRSLAWARGFVSGLLIGGEIADIDARRELPNALTLIGAPDLAALYQEALVRAGVGAHLLEADACVLSGLSLLHADD